LSKNIPGKSGHPGHYTPVMLLPGKSCLQVVGVTGLEPVTLRLSSACSNQLSYTPGNSGLPSRSPQRLNFGVFSTARLLCFALPCFGAAASLGLRCERRLVELRRFEPLTYSLQSYRSTN
jgi:hypothetical protein